MPAGPVAVRGKDRHLSAAALSAAALSAAALSASAAFAGRTVGVRRSFSGREMDI
ncbi:hypothetical protein [Streptomyces sp. NPDC058613]|uniref:hypothetical protein n=1 Tax=Streptomyces sp. NPDC058613 TaxID=3346556 RepID=UPI00365D54C8